MSKLNIEEYKRLLTSPYDVEPSETDEKLPERLRSTNNNSLSSPYFHALKILYLFILNVILVLFVLEHFLRRDSMGEKNIYSKQICLTFIL